MVKELNYLAKVVNLNQVFTLLAYEKNLSGIAIVAGIKERKLQNNHGIWHAQQTQRRLFDVENTFS